MPNALEKMMFVLMSLPSQPSSFTLITSLLNGHKSVLITSIHVPDPDTKDILFGMLLRADEKRLRAITKSLSGFKNIGVQSHYFITHSK